MKRLIVLAFLLLPLFMAAQYPITASRLYFEENGVDNGELFYYYSNGDTVFINNDTFISASATGVHGNYTFKDNSILVNGVEFIQDSVIGGVIHYYTFKSDNDHFLQIAPQIQRVRLGNFWDMANNYGSIVDLQLNQAYLEVFHSNGYNAVFVDSEDGVRLEGQTDSVIDNGTSLNATTRHWVRREIHDSIAASGGGTLTGNFTWGLDTMSNGGDKVIYKPNANTFRFGNDSIYFAMYPDGGWLGSTEIYASSYDGVPHSSRYSQDPNNIKQKVYGHGVGVDAATFWLDTTQIAGKYFHINSKSTSIVLDSTGARLGSLWGGGERWFYLNNGDTNGMVITNLQTSYPNTITQYAMEYDTNTGRIVLKESSGGAYWEDAGNTNAIRRTNLAFPVPVDYIGVGGIKASEMYNATHAPDEIVMRASADSTLAAYPFQGIKYSNDTIRTNIKDGTSIGEMNYWDGSNWVLADKMYWDNTKNRYSIGTPLGALDPDLFTSSISRDNYYSGYCATSYVANTDNRISGGLMMRRARGTGASPTQVAVGDRIGWFLASGFNGVTWKNPVGISMYVENVTYNSSIGANMKFETSPNGAVRYTRLVIVGNGNIGIGDITPVNLLDVAGATSIGSGYAGISTIAADALAVESGISINTTALSGYMLNVNGATNVQGNLDITGTLDGINLSDSLDQNVNSNASPSFTNTVTDFQVLTPQATAPSSPVNGTIYINSTDSTLRMYYGAWIILQRQ